MTEGVKVKADWFISSVFLGEADLTKEGLAILVDHAEVYLRATGAISWSEWQCLSTQSRAAFEQAGQRIEEVKIAKLADLVSLRLLAALRQQEAVPE